MLASAAFLFGLYQVPKIAERVLENAHRPIGFMTRLFLESDALGLHCGIVAGEIIRMQKEAHAATGLVANGRVLRRTIRLGE